MKLTRFDRLLFPSWFRDRWERVRSKGILCFILRSGLVMGMLMFIITSPLFLVVPGQSFTLRFALKYFVSWVVGGVVLGFLTWICNEALYRRSKLAD